MSCLFCILKVAMQCRNMFKGLHWGAEGHTKLARISFCGLLARSLADRVLKTSAHKSLLRQGRASSLSRSEIGWSSRATIPCSLAIHYIHDHSLPTTNHSPFFNNAFVHPQKAGERNFFNPVSRNPWEVIISGPVQPLGAVTGVG